MPKVFCYLRCLVTVFIVLQIVACASPVIVPQPLERVSGNSAALGLYQQAQALLSRGETEQAKAKVERALRIESDNPYLWFQMAQIEFIEQDYALAREMAKRAKSFAAGNGTLQRDINKFLRQLTNPDYNPFPQ